MNLLKPNIPLPVDIVLAPEWWYKNTGITFDKDFFFHIDKYKRGNYTLSPTYSKYRYSQGGLIKWPTH